MINDAKPGFLKRLAAYAGLSFLASCSEIVSPEIPKIGNSMQPPIIYSCDIKHNGRTIDLMVIFDDQDTLASKLFYKADFGDGSINKGVFSTPIDTFRLSHTYESEGTFPLEFIVSKNMDYYAGTKSGKYVDIK
jgi:hypothetical protein